ncbi:hypothetical protein [Streptomyces sp. NPDC059122]|uniref:hypothetical protein n=1 Tax=Streptomyces sp. NPDC059122 TaxID=3346732 RepID=UPI0036B3FF7A
MSLSQEDPQTPAQLAREQVAKARKARRYAGRRTLWRITGDPACKGCGRALMDPESGVILGQTASGASVLLGVMRCARIWLCPVCMATIRHKRAEEITRAVVEWIGRGGTAYLVTLTARHASKDLLADLMDAIQGSRSGTAAEVRTAKVRVAEAEAALQAAQEETRAAVTVARLAAPKGQKRAAMAQAKAAAAEGPLGEAGTQLAAARAELTSTRRTPGAYQRLITGGTWAGRPDRDEAGIRDRVGYIGMIRATEVTLGLLNGWHPHIHAIVLVGGRTTGERAEKTVAEVFDPSEEALAEWQDHWRTVWVNALKAINPRWRPSDDCDRADCPCGGRGHAIDFKRLETEADAKDLAKYIAKTQDGKAPALELTRFDLKEAQGDNVTPLELLYRIGDLTGGVHPDEASGIGTLEWNLTRWHEYERATKGRRAIEWTRYLRQMLGIEGGDTQEDDLDLLAGADAEAGELRAGVSITDKGWTAVTARGLDLAATEAAEGKDGNDDPEAVGDRVREVLSLADVAEHVVVLNAGQVAEAYEAMLESLARRREEAAARRRREAEDQDEEEEREAVEGRAKRHIDRIKAAQEKRLDTLDRLSTPEFP